MLNLLIKKVVYHKKQHIINPFKTSNDFKFFYLGQFFSTCGSSIVMFIIPILVFQLSSSTKTMGNVMFFYMCSCIIALLFSGVIADKINRIKIMIFTNFFLCLVLIAFSVLIFTDKLTIPLIYFLICVVGLMDSLYRPAYAGMRAKIFTPEIRNIANSILEISRQLIKIVSPLVGSFLITIVSISSGFCIYSIAFVISIIFLYNLKSIDIKSNKISNNNIFSVKNHTKTIKILKSNSWLWYTIISFTFINICTGGIIRILVPWLITSHYSFQPIAYGILTSATAGGSVCCAVIYGAKKKWSNRGLLAYGGVVLCGLSFLLMTFSSYLPFLFILMFFCGFGNMIFMLVWEISLQEMVPDEYFGRVASIDMFLSLSLLPMGYMITGWLAESIGGINTMKIYSIFILLLVLIAISKKDVRGYN